MKVVGFLLAGLLFAHNLTARRSVLGDAREHGFDLLGPMQRALKDDKSKVRKVYEQKVHCNADKENKRGKR